MSEQDDTVETAPGAPTGLKAKAQQVGLKAYLKMPPPAQQKTIAVMMKVMPVVQKVKPHAKKLAVAGVGLLAVRKVKRRG
jgi:gamma-glutamyl:cysteine ligase YbdK (ATP-grasp superfamily)